MTDSEHQYVELSSEKPTRKVVAATWSGAGGSAVTNAVILLLGHYLGVSPAVGGALAVVATSVVTMFSTYLGGYMALSRKSDLESK